jgi:hypothetical protein
MLAPNAGLAEEGGALTEEAPSIRNRLNLLDISALKYFCLTNRISEE